MTVFLFDEDHPDLDVSFGPQCASFIIRALEDVPNLPPIRILYGALLHTRYCYELSKVSLREKDVSVLGAHSMKSGQHFNPNLDRFLTIICDLAETMSASGSSMSEDELQNVLAKKNIWAIVTQGLADECRSKVENSLKNCGAFLGWVKVDWGNPIHADIFANSLFQDMFIDENGIYKLSKFEVGSEEREEEDLLIKEYKSKREVKLLNHEEFHERAPELFTVEDPSERALLSVRRIAGETTSHRMKVGKALAHSYDAVGSFRTFSTLKPEDGIEFFVPEAKLTKYLLNLDHPKGGAKAQFFRDTLNIIKEDWRFLADQFCQAASNSEFYRLEVTGYGVMHGAQVLITGRNGRQAVIETGWKLEEVGPAQFVTAYPGDEKKLGALEAFPGRVPEVGLSSSDRWRAIHEMAHTNGMKHSEKKTPTPMLLEGGRAIWEGACGFGWVSLPNARVPFAKWALKEGIGFATRPGVHISSKLKTQSVQKNFAYAVGYAQVLKANGIECRAESRLD